MVPSESEDRVMLWILHPPTGVLRKNPNIKWEKDRGKNPPGSPWGEDRINDRNLTLKEKRDARQKKR